MALIVENFLDYRVNRVLKRAAENAEKIKLFYLLPTPEDRQPSAPSRVQVSFGFNFKPRN